MAPRETENNAYAKFGVTNKEYYGMLWYFLEWSIKGKYAIFIKYALINLDEITLSRNILAFLFSFGLTNYLFHRIPVCARKDLLDFPDEMV